MTCSACSNSSTSHYTGTGHDRIATPAAAAMGKLPTEQCLECAQKHFDESWCLFLEYGYGRENMRLVRGNLRAIVLHTYKSWPTIASLARECALLMQRKESAEDKMRSLGDMIDDAMDNAAASAETAG